MAKIPQPGIKYIATGNLNYNNNDLKDWIEITSVGNIDDYKSSTSGATVVKAQLTKPFVWSGTANYTEYGKLSSISTNKKRIEASTGNEERYQQFSAYTHKSMTGNLLQAKVYQGGTVSIPSFEFRLFEDGTGNSFTPFRWFTRAVYPQMDKDKMNSIIDAMENSNSKTWNILGGVQNLAAGFIESGLLTISDFWKAIGLESEAAKGNIESISDYFAMLNGKNKTFNINVSDICSIKNLVVQTYSTTFSREKCKFENTGKTLPIYVDYTVQFEPLVQPTFNEIEKWFNGDGNAYNYVKSPNPSPSTPQVNTEAAKKTQEYTEAHGNTD